MPPALTIHPKDGSLHLSNLPLTLFRGIAQSEVTLATTSFFLNHSDFRNGYEWLRLHQLTFGGRPCILSLCFHLGKLSEAHLANSDPSRPGEWPTREQMDAEIAFARAELGRQLGRPFASGAESFPWGVAWSSYDAKSDSASSGLRYAPTPSAPRSTFTRLAHLAAPAIAIGCLLSTVWLLAHLGYHSQSARLSTDPEAHLAAFILFPGWIVALSLAILARPVHRLTILLAAVGIVLASFLPRAFILNQQRHKTQLQETAPSFGDDKP